MPDFQPAHFHHYRPLPRQKAKSLASKLSCHAIQILTTILNARHALHFQGWGCWARGSGEQEKESPG
eukprot:227837-Pelagomonas_calceolata.AAC.1